MVPSNLIAIAVTVPAVMLTVASIASAASSISNRDKRVTRRAMMVSGGVIIAGAAMSGNVPLILATIIAVGTITTILTPHLEIEQGM